MTKFQELCEENGVKVKLMNGKNHHYKVIAARTVDYWPRSSKRTAMYKDDNGKNVVLRGIDNMQAINLALGESSDTITEDLNRLILAYEELIQYGVDSSIIVNAIKLKYQK